LKLRTHSGKPVASLKPGVLKGATTLNAWTGNIVAGHAQTA
jgi:hypothetical protein